MNYTIEANSSYADNAMISIKGSKIEFGTTSDSEENLANPAELFLGALGACILKSVERFSKLLNFEYSKAEISVSATREEKPPSIDLINYELKIYSQDGSLNVELLKRNIEKFGTIYNTVSSSCSITGNITIVSS